MISLCCCQLQLLYDVGKYGSLEFSVLPHSLPFLSAETITTAEAFYLHLKICSTPTLCADAFINVHVSLCVRVHLCVCVCASVCLCFQSD